MGRCNGKLAFPLSHGVGTSARSSLTLFILCVCFCPAASFAQTTDDFHPFLSDRFNITAGVFFPHKSFKIRVDGRDPEEEIDFEEALGLDDDEVVGSLTFRWRFGKTRKWSLWGQYWGVSDSAGAVLTEDIEWEDVVFQEGTFARGGVEQEIVRIFIGREFFTTQPNHEFGLGVGVHWMSLDAFIEGQVLTSEGDLVFRRESVSEDFPLPNIGAWYGYSWGPNWLFQARLDWLSASAGDYDGGLWNGQAGIHWQAFEHIGFGFYSR